MQLIRNLLITVMSIFPSSYYVKAAGCAELSIGNCHDLAPLLATTTGQHDVLNKVLATPELFKVQILYTQIDRKPDNKVEFIHYQFGLDESRYYYPASTVKLPVSLLALQWLNQHQQPGVNRKTTMFTDSSRPVQTEALADETAENKLPSVAHYIKKILLVSDNDAYNRLYELLGQEYINSQLHDKGLTNTVINHRLSLPLPELEQRHYNPIRFVDEQSKPILSLPARSSETRFVNQASPMLGKAHIANGELVDQPMDFSDKNRFSVADYAGVLQRIFFPQSFSSAQQFDISEQDRLFVIKYMGIAPASVHYPAYDSEEYPDNYAKFLLVGGQDQPAIPSHLRIFNKTGWAYGHAIDGAYIVDTNKNIEFMLMAVIYANENDTLNDDNYQLNEIAKPFMRQLGQLIYQHELQRPRKVVPELTQFKELPE
ncbi:Beta-lactamase enzyme family protein [Arsukibacterium tuosuense]|uniref:beta-lactamase n=1 Tax=Arsukibacterium tuosuense TaxID=1323745 RepID=A0A285JPB2_9GAMM|nr:serine hydrolase [Arsukibacterium tuosuense]SNY60911.1 Beta-lactamase enzyme family protein [Arsukibacterium tuosuense]